MTDWKLDQFNEVLVPLKGKWKEVPATRQERMFSSDLLQLADKELLQYWENLFHDNCMEAGYSTRGWFHDLYKPLALLEGQWLDVGSGLGFDGMYFAEMGAQMTFADIVEENLLVIEKLCKLKGLKNVDFFNIESLEALNQLSQCDVIMAIGSLHHAPYELIREERKILASHLTIGGRWLELGYPKERWEREGSLDFSDWGEKTDGENTPWAEWYDVQKLLRSLDPYPFDIILDLNFHDNDFNWFDLIKRPS